MSIQEFMWQTVPWMLMAVVVLLIANHLSYLNTAAEIIVELREIRRKK